MDLSTERAEKLDALLVDFAHELREAGAENAAATLGYTHGIHRAWRQVVRMLPIPAGSSILDVGTGLGLLPIELAANAALQVHGVDVDAEFITHADALEQRLANDRFFITGAAIDFSVGDACDLDFPERSFDLVFIREVLQFVSNPEAALKEAFRVLRPGGYACVGDTDDQLRITWPPASPALERLIGAVSEAQHARGGDRQMGRKLTTYLRSAGFTINSLVVLPEAQHRLVGADDAERTLVLEQLRAVRSVVLAHGSVDAETYDADLRELEQQDPFEEFRLSGRIIVLAQRPGE